MQIILVTTVLYHSAELVVCVWVVQAFRSYAKYHGGSALVISIFLDSGVLHMFASVVPSLTYYWMHPEVGTRQCLYDWQKRIPWHGFMVQKTFRCALAELNMFPFFTSSIVQAHHLI